MKRQAPARSSGRWIVWTLVPAALLLFVGANAHLVYVAVTSQPDCVAHLKEPSRGEGYRAARSSC